MKIKNFILCTVNFYISTKFITKFGICNPQNKSFADITRRTVFLDSQIFNLSSKIMFLQLLCRRNLDSVHTVILRTPASLIHFSIMVSRPSGQLNFFFADYEDIFRKKLNSLFWRDLKHSYLSRDGWPHGFCQFCWGASKIFVGQIECTQTPTLLEENWDKSFVYDLMKYIISLL